MHPRAHVWMSLDGLQVSSLTFLPCLRLGLCTPALARLAGLQASGEAPVSSSHLPTGVLGLQVLLPLLQLTLTWVLGIQTL